MARKPSFQKRVSHVLEYILLTLYLGLCRLVGPKRASDMGGTIGRFIGSKLGKSRTVTKRIEEHMKGIDPHETMMGMWDNLGRVLSEYPHLRYIAKHKIDIENPEFIRKTIDIGKPILFVGGHCANWELQTMILFAHFGVGISPLYRPPNNPYVDKALQRMRKIDVDTTTIAKSAAGAKTLIKAMRDEQPIGFLFDQKFNKGDVVPLFGEDARSYTGIVPLCQKYDYTIFPVQIKRQENDPSRFIFRAHPPIELNNKNGKPKEAISVYANLHSLLESWVKEAPSEWLWLHDRWGKPIPRRFKKKKK